MPNPSAAYDVVTLLIDVSEDDDLSNWAAIGNPTELGLFVPALTSSTLTVKVARDAAGTGASNVFDATGTQKLTFPAGTGGFAISSNEMGALLGYSHMAVATGTGQAADRTFHLVRKVAGIDPSA